MDNHDTVRALANDIDRLAYLVDPAEYNDVVGTTEDDIAAHVDTIAADLASGRTRDYADWLAGLLDDDSVCNADKQRAAARLDRLNAFVLDGMKARRTRHSRPARSRAA